MTTLPTQQVTWNPTTEVRQRLRLESDTWVEVKVQNDGDFSGEEIQSLTTWALRQWLVVAKKVRGEDVKPETEPKTIPPAVTVTGTFIEPTHKLPVTVAIASNTAPAKAYEDIAGVLAATSVVIGALAKAGIQQIDTPSPAPAPGAPSRQPQNQQSGSGVIKATRCPNTNQPAYKPGQQVEFHITKVVKGSQNGSVIYQLWGPLGKRFPLHTIFQDGTDGNESVDWQRVSATILPLNLSVDAKRLEATVNWRFVTEVVHREKDGATKEYFNAVSLEEA